MDKDGPKRKLTTILCADCAGYSRMMRADEEGTYRILHHCRQLIDKIIGTHEGRIFGTAGDSVVAEFQSPVEAVRSAIETQRAIAEMTASLPEAQRMHFRIGINLGDVLIEGSDLIGDGVNVAARLQQLSQPGGICVSASVHEQVKNKLKLNWEDIGDQSVKNITEPVHVYRLQLGTSRVDQPRPLGMVAHKRGRNVGAAAVMLLAGGLLAAYFVWRTPTPQQCTQASIAVLPFTNLSGDAKQDYFSDGTTEDIIAALARFSDLAVIAHSAVQKYKGKSFQPADLNRELGVCYALEGSVRRTNDRVLVSAQLLDTQNGRLLWSEGLDGELKDLFALRNQITQGVVGKLAIKIQDIERQRALKKPTERLDAYDYVLRGRDYYARETRSANNDARLLYEQAIQLDPGYASAHAALGFTHLVAANFGWTEFADEALLNAERLARKAIALDRDNAEAHRLLGEIHFRRGQFDLAVSEDDRAIELNPNDAESYDARGGNLVYGGNAREALKSIEIAKRLNPSASSTRLENLGWANYLEQRYEDAVTDFAMAARMSPENSSVRAGLAAAYAQLGRMNNVSQAVDDLKRVWPFFTVNGFTETFQGDANRALIVDGLRKAGLR